MPRYRMDLGTWENGFSHNFTAINDLEAMWTASKLFPKLLKNEDDYLVSVYALLDGSKEKRAIFDYMNGFYGNKH